MPGKAVEGCVEETDKETWRRYAEGISSFRGPRNAEGGGWGSPSSARNSEHWNHYLHACLVRRTSSRTAQVSEAEIQKLDRWARIAVLRNRATDLATSPDALAAAGLTEQASNRGKEDCQGEGRRGEAGGRRGWREEEEEREEGNTASTPGAIGTPRCDDLLSSREREWACAGAKRPHGFSGRTCERGKPI